MDTPTPKTPHPEEPPPTSTRPRLAVKAITYESPNNPWMFTLSDLLGLMLAFFILIYAASTVNVQKLSGLSDALTQRLHLQPQDILQYDAGAHSNALQAEKSLPMGYLYAVLRNKLAQTPSLTSLDVLRTTDAVMLLIPEKDWFIPNSAQLTSMAKKKAMLLAETLNSLGNNIQVVGYADHHSFNQEKQRMLALQRALALTTLMQSSGYNVQVEILGKVNDIATMNSTQRSIEIIMMPAQIGYHDL